MPHDPELERFEQFLVDLATPYANWRVAQVGLIQLAHETPPASVRRWTGAIDRYNATLYALRELITSYQTEPERVEEARIAELNRLQRLVIDDAAQES